jgi:hypothetical protein
LPEVAYCTRRFFFGEGITSYLAAVQERLRAAEVERAAAQARAEEEVAKAAAERRARRLLVGLAAAALLLVLVGAAAGILQRQAHRLTALTFSDKDINTFQG